MTRPAHLRALVLFLLIATAVGVAATLGLSTLQQRLERSRMAQTAITEIRLDTTALAAITLMTSQRPAVARTMEPFNASTMADLTMNLRQGDQPVQRHPRPHRQSAHIGAVPCLVHTRWCVGIG